MMVLSLLSVLQRRGVEHEVEVLVAHDLCSCPSSLTLRGTREGGRSAQWPLLHLAIRKVSEASWISLGRARWQLLFLSVASCSPTLWL